MRRLILLRHGKSAWPDGAEDLERPLAKRGHAASERMGRYLAAEELVLARRWSLRMIGRPVPPPVKHDNLTASPLTKSRSARMAKTKLPKKILGLKIPKKLRKADFVQTLLSDPVGREILAGAVAAAAGAAATALAKHRPTAELAGGAGSAAADAGTAAAGATKDLVHGAASALAGAITQLATQLHPGVAEAAEAKSDERAAAADKKARGTGPRKNAKKEVPVVRATH